MQCKSKLKFANWHKSFVSTTTCIIYRVLCDNERDFITAMVIFYQFFLPHKMGKRARERERRNDDWIFKWCINRAHTLFPIRVRLMASKSPKGLRFIMKALQQCTRHCFLWESQIYCSQQNEEKARGEANEREMKSCAAILR